MELAPEEGDDTKTANMSEMDVPVEKKDEKEPESKSDQINKKCQDVFDKYPFDIMEKKMMLMLHNDIQTFRIRVFLISAQNLTAQSTQLDWKSRLAGMTALCTANPYPKLYVGDDKKENPTLIKSYDRREDDVMDQNINPKYFKIFELDAQFPEDWKLELQIWNKGFVSLADKLIGSTVIDLENRLHSNLLYLNKHALKFY